MWSSQYFSHLNLYKCIVLEVNVSWTKSTNKQLKDGHTDIIWCSIHGYCEGYCSTCHTFNTHIQLYIFVTSNSKSLRLFVVWVRRPKIRETRLDTREICNRMCDCEWAGEVLRIGRGCLEKSRRDEVPSVFLSPVEFFGFLFFS